MYIIILLLYCITIVFISFWYDYIVLVPCFLYDFVYTSMISYEFLQLTPQDPEIIITIPEVSASQNGLQEQKPPKGRNCRLILGPMDPNTWNLKKGTVI